MSNHNNTPHTVPAPVPSNPPSKYLYQIVYSETAFRGLDSHPAMFETLSEAKALLVDGPEDQYIIRHTVVSPK